MKTEIIIMPSVSKILKELGENIRLARRRRKLKAKQIAERANISRPTLLFIEKGSPKVAMGNYLNVLFALGLEKDFLTIARDDVFGRKLQDIEITKNKKP